MVDYVKVATLEELPPNSVKPVEVEGMEIALFNVDDEIYALENTCRECGTVLSKAVIRDGNIGCPHHGWTIDLDEGVCPVCPDEEIRKYRVKIEGNDVFVFVRR